MTKFKYINDNLLTPHGIKDQLKLGIIPTAIMRHFAVYSRYDYYRKQGHKKYHAISFINIDLNISESSIIRIIKDMETEL